MSVRSTPLASRRASLGHRHGLADLLPQLGRDPTQGAVDHGLEGLIIQRGVAARQARVSPSKRVLPSPALEPEPWSPGFSRRCERGAGSSRPCDDRAWRWLPWLIWAASAVSKPLPRKAADALSRVASSPAGLRPSAPFTPGGGSSSVAEATLKHSSSGLPSFLPDLSFQFCEIIFCARFRVAWRRFRLVSRPGHLPGGSARAYARPAFSSSSVVLSVCQRPAGIPMVSRRRGFCR